MIYCVWKQFSAKTQLTKTGNIDERKYAHIEHLRFSRTFLCTKMTSCTVFVWNSRLTIHKTHHIDVFYIEIIPRLWNWKVLQNVCFIDLQSNDYFMSYKIDWIEMTDFLNVFNFILYTFEKIVGSSLVLICIDVYVCIGFIVTCFPGSNILEARFFYS